MYTRIIYLYTDRKEKKREKGSLKVMKFIEIGKGFSE